MFSTLSREEDKKLVISCITSLNYFKGFSVMRTVSVAETAQHIVYMAEKMEKEIKNGKNGKYYKINNVNVEANTDSGISVTTDNCGVKATDYCGVVKASKKANITKENIGEMILMQIPGISSVTAIEIMRPFGNFLEFIDKIRNDSTYLNSVILEASGKKRKLGTNIIKSINELLLNTNVTEL
jgi:ERCC4-type nuclease